MTIKLADEKTLEQIIGSMLVIGFEGTSLDNENGAKILSYLSDNLLGGVILFRHNIISPQQLAQMTTKLKAAKQDLIIAIDQEGGKVQRLTLEKGFTAYPAPEKVAELPENEAKQIYKNLSAELSSYGINLNFAPLVDVNNKTSLCPVIGGLGRSFSDNTDVIVKYGSICIDAHHENKVLTAIKHFPGHGFASGDSHLGMVDVTETASEIELVPFYELIAKQKVDMIMTAHIINKNIDSNDPATLSEVTIKKLLRDKGYDGVIVSDDLHMGAVQDHYSFKDTIIKAIKAGVDLLIFSNNPLACKNVENFIPDHDIPLKMIDIVKEAINEGILSEDMIDRSANRIELLKDSLFDDASCYLT